MKEWIYLITLFMIYLIFQHFIKKYFAENPIIEGLENCDLDQNDLVYKNKATISQQQQEINDFKKSIMEELNNLQKKIKSFNIKLTNNKKNITTNATSIKSSISNIHDAVNQKSKELDKFSGTDSSSS
jgi:hypothetical protein